MSLSRLLPARLRGGSSRRASTRRALSGTSLALVASGLVLMAVNADGTPISDVDLHDGSVWVTNSRTGYQLLGRLNPQIRQLDLGIQALSGDFDVFQDGSRVVLDVRSGGRGLREVDVAAGVAHEPTALTPRTVVAYGGDTFAVLDRDSGAGWVLSPDEVRGFAQDRETPDVTVGRDGAVDVGTDGTAYFFSSERRTVTPVSSADTGESIVGDAAALPADFGTEIATTVVGDVPVLYDRDSDLLSWPGRKSAVRVRAADPSSVQLQEPGTGYAIGDHVAEDGVLVATRSELLRVDLDDTARTTVRDGFDGPPAPPVVHRGSVHAAWADRKADAYVRLDVDGTTRAEKIPAVAGTARLVFRVNRDVVVLNDTVTGLAWSVQEEGLPRTDNWDDVHPSKQKKRTSEASPDERTKAQRTEKNRPPTAVADELGARPGADSLLPLTRNDTDPDGDLLTIAEVEHLSGPEPEQIAVVGDGTMLQVRFAPGQGGNQARFRYVVSDGRTNGTAEAIATVRVVPQSENRAPEPVVDGTTPRRTSMSVARGQRAAVHVLKDWTDADGDPLVLTSASLDSGGTVSFRPDGLVEFVDDGETSGEKSIEVTVSDGREGGEATGTVTVDVARGAGAAPELVPDRAVGVAGTEIVVAPLSNDFSRDGTPLRLRDVVALGGLEVRTDPTEGTFRVRTARAGTYYLDYSAYSDRGEAASFVRLDVLAPSDENRPPVAMRDEALIPPGGHVLVDLLANDSDPEGDVLAVTELQVPPASGVKASLLENRLVRLESARDLNTPVTVGYTVSDGNATAQGSVVVGSAGARTENRPPVATDDRITVRAGAVATVAVLDNDFDPDGDDLQLFGQDLVKPDDLPLFVSGSRLRFRAPDTPGEVRATYGVRDSRGQRDDAELVIDVVADHPDVNAAPRPEPVVARAVGSAKVRVDLDLAGADPDGDAVSVKSLRTMPALGRITATGLDWVEYEPFGDTRTGTDTFEVEVQDKYGAVGVQTVRVGVTPRAGVNQPPVAMDDRVAVRPGRTVQFDVLRNDNDADGDDLVLSEELTTSTDTVARVEDGLITVDVPGGDTVTQSSVGYRISDGAGGTDTARLVAEGNPDAPLHAPITVDDAAELADVAGRKPGDTVLVDVLANDGDLDGRRSDLELRAFDTDVSAVQDNQLNIELAATDQVVVYEVSDGDGNVSYGFVFVAGTDTVPPVVDPNAEPNPIEVESGKSVEIDLRDHVLVRAGRTPRLTVGDRVSSAPYAGAASVTGGTGVRFTAPKDRHGPASMTFEVTDGDGLNDPTGLTSLLTLAVDVVPPKGTNLPPEMRNLSVQVVAGDEAEMKRVDLAPHATDPNPDDTLTFTAEGTTSVEARVEDSTLVLAATDAAEDGDVVDIPVTVTDSAGAQATGRAIVTVVRSDKPLVEIGTIGPLEATAGEPLTVDVGDHATNPYPDRPLSVSGATVESGEGRATASGSTVTLTPASSHSGAVVVSFTVRDGSGDPERDVIGRLEATVVAAPDAPGRPTVSETTHDAVTLAWPAAADRGAPVTAHTVSWDGGSTDCGPATTCRIGGLTPGQAYTFSVAATNRIGTSDPGPASAGVIPDKVPERMSPPAVSQDYAARDGRLDLSWQAPANEGSTIRSYEVHLLGTEQVRTATAGATGLTWTGLPNGEQVQFRVRAVNDITDEARKQAFSEPSSPDKAFGVPARVGRPTAVASADDGIPGGTVEVTWNAADDNGDPVERYEVTMYRGGSPETTRSVTGTSAHFDVDNGARYTFTVTAHNRAGASPDSETSAVVSPWDRASAVRGLAKVDAGEGDRTGRVTFSAPADDGGRPVVEYVIASTGGPSRTVSSAGTHDVTFTANDGPYTVTVTPVTQDDQRGKVQGAPATVQGLRPFGAPLPPGDLKSRSTLRSVSFTWQAPRSNGRPVRSLQARHGTGAWQDVTGKEGLVVETTGPEQEVCLELRVIGEGGTPTSPTLTSDPRDARVCGSSAPATLTAGVGTSGSGQAVLHFVASGVANGEYKLFVRSWAGNQAFIVEDTYTHTATGPQISERHGLAISGKTVYAELHLTGPGGLSLRTGASSD